MGIHQDFWQITQDALYYAMKTLGTEDGRLFDRLMDLYLGLEAFPEVSKTLDQLKATGLKTAILSNGSPEMLAA